MIDRPTPGAVTDSVSADHIAHRGFSVSRRGFEQDEVREFLLLVAGAVRGHQDRVERLEAALASAQQAAKSPTLDEDTLMRLVGEETASILRSARSTAADMRTRAETESAGMMTKAEVESAEMRTTAHLEATEVRDRAEAEVSALRTAVEQEASELRARADAEAARIVDEARQGAGDRYAEADAALGRATDEAEQAAARIRGAAQDSADQLLGRARTESETLRQQAEHDRKLTVEGAQAVRDKILGDLDRRRRVATIQIEQLRIGRERLLEAYAVVRRTLEEVNDELHRADTEAREAAAAAGDLWEGGEGAGLADRTGDPSSMPDGGVSAELHRGVASAEPDGGEMSLELDRGVSVELDGGDVSAEVGVDGASAEEVGGEGPGDAPGTGATPDVWTGERPGRVRVLSGSAATGSSLRPANARPPSHPARSTSSSRPGSGPASTRPSPIKDTDTGEEEEAGLPGDPTEPETAIADLDGVTPEVHRLAAAGQEEPDPAPEEVPGTVDDLFARIRAGRQDAVIQAREVLRSQDRSAGAGEVAAESVAAESAAAESGESESGAAESGAAESGAAESGAAESGAAESGAAETGGAGSAVVTGVDAVGEGVEDVEGDGELEPRRSDEEESWLELRDDGLRETETVLTRKLKRALQDEQSDLLDRLRSLRGRPTAAGLLPSAAEQRSRFSVAASTSIEQAAREGTRFSVRQLGTDAGTVGQPGSAVPVEDLVEELAASIVEPLRRRLEQSIDDAGDDEQAVLIGSFGAAYREWKTQRIERIAGDILTASFARGVVHATPSDATLRWVMEDVDGPCSDCDDNVLAGPVPKAEAFPTGQLHPPAHAGCRCLVVPATS